MSRRPPACLLMLILILLGAVSPLAAAPALPIAQPAPRQRDLLAEAGENRFWIARVNWDQASSSNQTSIIFREKWSGPDDWQNLPIIPDRVVSMASSNGELLLVLASGQWEIADDTDIRSGPTGGLWDKMLAIAAGPDTIWAVVRSLPATTQQSATTLPSTIPSTQVAPEPALMISQFENGQWTKMLPIPGGISNDPSQIALTVVNSLPMLAWRQPDGRVSISELSPSGQWSPASILTFAPGPLDFKLLTINKITGVLWTAAAPPSTQPTNAPPLTGGGDLTIGNDFTSRKSLTPSKPVLSGITSQTLVAAFGNLRWIAYAGKEQIEQDYSLDHFPESFPPAKLPVVTTPRVPVILLTPWIGGDAVLLIMAALAAVRQKNLPAPDSKPNQRDPQPALAPIGVRFVAGMVDLAPMLAVAAIFHPANASSPLANVDPDSFAELFSFALATYLLHTLIAELICGQSLGKIIFGLRVLKMDGTAPTRAQIVSRNLLRVADIPLILPLVVLLITPLHQRVGDLAAGTVVAADIDEDQNNGDE